MRAVVPLALLAAALPGPARSAELSATTTTIARGFDRLDVRGVDPDQLQAVRTYRPVDQLVRVTWDDAGPRAAWTFDAHVRFRLDAATGRVGGRFDPFANRVVDQRQDEDLDVLLATAAWASRTGFLELRLGRQQSITGFGWHAFDGVRLDLPKSRHVRGFVFAGLPVELGDNGWSDRHGGTWGAGITGVLGRHGSLGVEYELRRFDEHVSEESFGANLGLRFGETTVEADADYSALLDTFGEVSVAVRHVTARRPDFEARFTRTRPVFPLDDDAIWLVFDLNPYDEARLSYEHRGRSGFDVGGFLSREMYEESEEPEPGALPADEVGDAIRRAAVTLRWEGAREAAHRSEIGWQDGWTGSRLAARHDSDFGLTPRLRLGAGASFQRYENVYSLGEEDQDWALRARLRHDAGAWDVGVEVEQLFGKERDTLRAMLAFGTRWGAARATRKWWEPWWGGRWRDAMPRGTRPPSDRTHLDTAVPR